MVTKLVAQIIMIFIFMFWLTKTLLSAAAAAAACQDKCGNVSIPYPFGIEPGCYMDDGFALTCVNSSRSSPPKPFITASINLEVLDISVTSQTVRVMYPILSKTCVNNEQANFNHSGISLTGTPFSFSDTDNRFMALGCDNLALMTSLNETTLGGCLSTCDTSSSSSHSGCYGVNCCQTTIPPFLRYFFAYSIGIGQGDNLVVGCKYAFLVEQKWFSESSLNASTVKDTVNDTRFVPAVLDWVVSGACDSLGKNASETTNSSAPPWPPTCYDNAYCYDWNQGHVCYCKEGYEGNPFLPQGCQDIDECADPSLNFCYGRCVNQPGSYSCLDPHPPQISLGLILGISIGAGLLVLLIFTWWLYKAIKRRNKSKLRKKFFKRNGGLLLEKQLSSGEGNVDKTKLFSSKELEKATDNYDTDRILGQGGQGTVYKGMLTDGRIVAVKKSKLVDEAKLEEFINEVVILSQIIHRNVVKLFGCCLETEVPMLVYEFIPKGSLYQYIHETKDENFPFSWEARLRIACEVAGALFYLHSAASSPIYHRDIKSSNILLDDNYRAKVSDFGTSRSVATDKTHLTTKVQGTFGYLDPEYFQSSQFTDKSDVYSFGVVLVELLTGEKAISSLRSQEEGRSLATYFIHSMKENRLVDILHAEVVKEAAKEEIIAVAKLALSCLNLNGKNRPTMKEVATVLEGIKRPQGGDGDLTNLRNYEEFDYNNVAAPWDDASTSTGSCLENSVSSSLDVQPLLLE